MTLIRPLVPEDYDRWAGLYQHYADHYGMTLTADGLAASWQWLMSADHPVQGLVADDNGQLIALAHFRAMPSPLRGQEIGYLDDLIVHPDARGQKWGEKMIKAVQEEAKRLGWPLVRWITRDHNYRARTLYDQMAERTNWVTYELPIEK